MIKSKIKVSGKIRSEKEVVIFGKIVSVIKTIKSRRMNPLDCIKSISTEKSLFE